MSSGSQFDDPLFLQRTLSGYAQAIASLATSFTGTAPPAAPDPAAVQAALEEGYRRLFAAATPAAGSAPFVTAASTPAGAFARYQAAAARWAEIISTIAQDAGGRLAEALREAGPGAPPITSLAALQALWIDCGEAAYGEAARREDFAAAQAELLMATVELSAAR
ncbi:MAG TPA: poly(R)-hydroxyalkanoic acid synthase subunit PhaE [Steroidobacteraceae bacterium]|nr:poly(R)-hydroxyalkanoic acid synthase subunit PhaE [Steroidobacteraceae bacterium]